MNTSLTRPHIPLKKIHLSRNVIRKLKNVSRLSSINQWEYVGNIKYKNFEFDTSEYTTSKRRDYIEEKDFMKVCNSPILYHTHPGISYPGHNTDENMEIFTTLPSNRDFHTYITMFPKIQVNIICDSHGYYVIDMISAASNHTIPLPSSVYDEMTNLRKSPGLLSSVFYEDGEYYHTTLKNWKRVINGDLDSYLSYLYGISIKYYAYEDDPPVITTCQDIYVA